MGIINKRYDAVVVGSGAGGSTAAWRLSSQGLRVLMLEAGPKFDPKRDYKLDQPDWERHMFPELPGSRGQFSIGTLDLLDPEEKELRSWGRASGIRVRGSRREPNGPAYWHVQGVGGSTLHFAGESHRMHPKAMQLQSKYGVGHDWPVSYTDLEPYYTICEQFVGVAGPANQGARWRSTPYPLPPHPLSTPAQRLVAAGKELGMNWQANSRAALSKPYDGRPACNYCANCTRGCPLGDKGSADVTYIPKGLSSGQLTLKSKCPVVRIFPEANGRIKAINYLENGQLQLVETPILIMAAGVVQTPRLLLTNKHLSHPDGLANSSGQVGRNLMETLFWSSTGFLPGLNNSHMGLPTDAICWDFNAPDSIPDTVGGCRFISAAQEIGFTGPIAYAARAIGGFGHKLKQAVRDNFGSAISVSAIGEFLPNDGTYVDLDPQETDGFGIPLPRLHSHLEPGEIKRLRFMARKSRRLLQEAGVEHLVEEYGAWDLFSTTHTFGTCRMGEDPTTSVVDANCRSHDHSNLYITDASIFPSSGGGESPSLTIQALATRAADIIAGGKPLRPSVPS